MENNDLYPDYKHITATRCRLGEEFNHVRVMQLEDISACPALSTSSMQGDIYKRSCTTHTLDLLSLSLFLSLSVCLSLTHTDTDAHTSTHALTAMHKARDQSLQLPSSWAKDADRRNRVQHSNTCNMLPLRHAIPIMQSFTGHTDWLTHWLIDFNTDWSTDW